MGWFPVLFYATVYVGELHKRASPVPDPTDAVAVRALEAEARRLGSRALLYSSLLSLATSVILPFFVIEARKRQPALNPPVANQSWIEQFQVQLGSLWVVSHLIFALCMFATFFSSTVSGATFLITVTGFSWAIALWAPSTFLAKAILSEHKPADTEDVGSVRLADSSIGDERQLLVAHDEEDEGRSRSPSSFDRESEHARSRPGVSFSAAAQMSQLDMPSIDGNSDGEDEARNDGSDGLSAKAGVILGISNIFVVIPQFIMSGLSSVVFAVFEPNKSILHGDHAGKIMVVNETSTTVSSQIAASTFLRRQGDSVDVKEGPNSISIIFQLGGIAAVIAFVLCWRLVRELKQR